MNDDGKKPDPPAPDDWKKPDPFELPSVGLSEAVLVILLRDKASKVHVEWSRINSVDSASVPLAPAYPVWYPSEEP
jgi:hypothetical protein